MTFAPSVLCPIDFSESSRGALWYAGTIASHFHTSLTLLAVNDPLLDEAAELTGGHAQLVDDTRREMERFHRQAFRATVDALRDVHFEIASGKPAPEILRVARERGCDLIVMGSHGSTGFRKLFFGSTTERVFARNRGADAGHTGRRSGSDRARRCAQGDPASARAGRS